GSGCGHLQRLVLTVFAAGHYSPGDASQFVGNGDHDFVTRCTLRKPVYPLPEPSGVVLDAKQHRASTMDQHATQISVATLADAKQLLLTSGRVLPGHNAYPGGKVTPAPRHEKGERGLAVACRNIATAH